MYYRVIVSVLFALSLISAAYIVKPVAADDLISSVTISVCGDGTVSEGEACDGGAGNNTGAYGSSTALRKCNSDCKSFGPYCGDSVLQVRFTEQCDDGNASETDLCNNLCRSLPAVPPGGQGAPPRGSTPDVPGAPPGAIPSEIVTKVVLRGKAYPLSTVNILLDGQKKDSVLADASADFVYSTTVVTPGTATFGLWAQDNKGIDSIINSVVFEVVQSAVTTVSNIFLPPTIGVNEKKVAVGDLLTVSGQTIPNVKVVTEINAGTKSTLNATSDGGGAWSLQVDTKSFKEGADTAKALFQITDVEKSGFGRSVSFIVGSGASLGEISADLNGDKKVNLVDFSIFLLSWDTDDIKSDFNLDGTVNLADFSIMLFNWTG